MTDAREVGAADDLPEGSIVGAGRYAVGHSADGYFAVTRRCRHLLADLAGGSIDDDGCLVCPWHQSRYDVTSGRMVEGPQGIYARVPGLGTAFKMLTRVVPLGRGTVTEVDDTLFVE